MEFIQLRNGKVTLKTDQIVKLYYRSLKNLFSWQSCHSSDFQSYSNLVVETNTSSCLLVFKILTSCNQIVWSWFLNHADDLVIGV